MMTDKERFAKLEERLAAAEARIAQLERQQATAPLDLFRFGGRPLPQAGDQIPDPMRPLQTPPIWCIRP